MPEIGVSNLLQQQPMEMGPVAPLPKREPLKKITPQEVIAASERPFEIGGTKLFLTVNAQDDRSDGAKDLGALVPESATLVEETAEKSIDNILARIPENQRSSTDILVIAAGGTLKTPGGLVSQHKRSVESGERVISGARKSLFKHHLLESQILNNSEASNAKGKPIEVTGLNDLMMFDQSPEFVKFMVDKYGTSGTALWEAYEADSDRETRIKMGVEGPEEIAERVNYVVSLQTQLAKEYHAKNPGRRLVIWAVGTYDSLSPYFKRYVEGNDPAKRYLGLAKGGGIALDIDPKGAISTTVQGQQFTVKTAA